MHFWQITMEGMLGPSDASYQEVPDVNVLLLVVLTLITWQCLPDVPTVKLLFCPLQLISILQADTLTLCKHPVSHHICPLI